ncbi:hypothetical protein SynA1544_02518 [Synechococcus sp. A15-44]|nr:hypothetical protein SynA1544_02518 [Synechococcus sp. A15-44]
MSSEQASAPMGWQSWQERSPLLLPLLVSGSGRVALLWR